MPPPPRGRHEQHLPPCMLNDISSENVIQAWPRWVSSDDDSSHLPPPSSIIFFPTTKPSEQAIYWPHFSRSPSNQSKIFRHICHLQAMTRHFSYTIFHQYTHFLFLHVYFLPAVTFDVPEAAVGIGHRNSVAKYGIVKIFDRSVEWRGPRG